MPANAIGLCSTIGLAKETVYGTAVVAAAYWEVISSSMDHELKRVVAPGIGACVAPTRRTRQQVDAGGQIEMLAHYEGIGMWIEAAMGASASSAGPAPYTHTYTLAKDLDSYTLEEWRGDDDEDIYTGCVVDQLVLSGANGGEIRGRWTWIARDGSRQGVGTTQSMTSDEHVETYHNGNMTFNAVTYTDVESFELTLNNKLRKRYHMWSLYTAKPVRNENAEITLKIVREESTQTLYDAHHAGTTGDVVLSWTNPVSGSVWEITLQNADPESYSSPLTSPGIRKETVTFRGFATIAQRLQGLEIKVINTQASAVAA